MRQPPFVEHCLELLAPLGAVRSRRMFGGWGLYVDDLFIAIIAADRLYLKAASEHRQRFADAGCEPFVYSVKDQSVGQMLDGLFAITRDFDMATQPHLLLLQKTMVMVEGLATQLWPDINMWEVSGPFVSTRMRDEMGPEAAIAKALQDGVKTIARLPDLLRRIEDKFPAKGGAPEQPPLPDVPLMWGGSANGDPADARGKRNPNPWARYIGVFLMGGVAAWLGLRLGWPL